MKIPKIITSERIILRKFIQKDFEAFHSFMTNKKSTKYLLFEDEQKTEKGIKELFDFTLNSYKEDMDMVSLAIADKKSDKYIGSIGFASDFYNGNIQIYWSINQEFENKGYATEAMKAFFPILKAQFTGKIRAYSHPNNFPSEKVALKLRMKNLGVQFIEPIGQCSKVFEM